MPGDALSRYVVNGDDREATAIFCGLAQRLQGAPAIPRAAKPLRQLADVFSRYVQLSFQPLLPGIVTDAASLFQQLQGQSDRAVLLHGDLHHDNILYGNNRGWCAIDPKGYVGDPLFEAGPFLKNPIGPDYYASSGIVQARIDTIRALTGWDADKLLQWAFCYAVISVIWSIEDAEYNADMLTMPTLLHSMISL